MSTIFFRHLSCVFLLELCLAPEPLLAQSSLQFRSLGSWPSPAREFVREVTVHGRYAYVGQGNHLVVFDIEQPTNAVQVGSFDCGGRPMEIVMQGGLAYVAADTAGFFILDMREPTNIVQVSRLLLSGGGQGNFYGSYSVQLVGGIAYVLTSYGQLHVLDISVPSQPKKIGYYNENKSLTGGSCIRVRNTVAYVLGIRPIEATTSLQILEVSSPTNIIRLGGMVVSAANGFDVSGNRAYVAYEGSLAGGLRILDLSTPTNIVVIGSYTNIGRGYKVQVVQHLAFVTDYNFGLHVLDVSNPSNVVKVGGHSSGGNPRELQVCGNLVYLADGLPMGLSILEYSGGPIVAPQWLLMASDDPVYKPLLWGLPTKGDLVVESSTGLMEGVPCQTNLLSGTTTWRFLEFIPASQPARFIRAKCLY